SHPDCRAILILIVAPHKPAARDRSFHQFVASLWPLAQECGVSRATFDRAFAGVSFDPKVAAAADEQPEFIRPIWDYLAAAVSPSRIERGRHKAQAEAAWLAKARLTDLLHLES